MAAEHAVAIVNGLWKGGAVKLKTLLTYRAAPLEYSEILLTGRQISAIVPQLQASLLPRWPNITGFRTSEKWAREKKQLDYNQCHGLCLLPQLQLGQVVWLPREEKPGTVIQQATTPRSYNIHINEGQIRSNHTHHNLRHYLMKRSQPHSLVTMTHTETCFVSIYIVAYDFSGSSWKAAESRNLHWWNMKISLQFIKCFRSQHPHIFAKINKKWK